MKKLTDAEWKEAVTVTFGPPQDQREYASREDIDAVLEKREQPPLTGEWQPETVVSSGVLAAVPPPGMGEYVVTPAPNMVSLERVEHVLDEAEHGFVWSTPHDAIEWIRTTLSPKPKTPEEPPKSGFGLRWETDPKAFAESYRLVSDTGRILGSVTRGSGLCNDNEWHIHNSLQIKQWRDRYISKECAQTALEAAVRDELGKEPK